MDPRGEKRKGKREKVSIISQAKASSVDLSYRIPSTQRPIGADKPWIHDCRIRHNLSSTPLYSGNKRPNKMSHFSTHNIEACRGKAKGRGNDDNRKFHLADEKVSYRREQRQEA